MTRIGIPFERVISVPRIVPQEQPRVLPVKEPEKEPVKVGPGSGD